MMLHGGGLSWWNYRDEAEILCDDYHVILPIIDGHADSGSQFESIELVADKLIEYINSNCNGKIKVLCGLSLGAQIAVGPGCNSRKSLGVTVFGGMCCGLTAHSTKSYRLYDR